MNRYKKAIACAAASLLIAVGLSACTPNADESVSSAVVSADADLTIFADGTKIGGKDVSGKTVEEALSICREAIEDNLNSLEITVKFKDDTISLSKGDFEVKDVLELTLPKLLKSRETGEHELSYVTDLSAAGEQKLQAAAQNCLVKEENATVAGFDTNAGTFTFTDGKNGTRVDMLTTLKSVRQLLSQKHGGAIQAAFLEIQPVVTRDSLAKEFKLMSSYTTESTNTSNGNSNMALALSHINGTVLQPGQVFSYNGTIGDSTDPSAGWLPAGGLMGGTLVQMYGGGICQGSTTLYNAALLAGMEIVDRDCHSTPSSYCPIGLDATVDYGNIDFKFKNPLEHPVYIAAWMDGVILHVNFYGCFPKEWDKVVIGSEQTGYEAPLTSVSFTEDENLAKGQYVRRSSGNSGYSAAAWRIYYKGEAEVKRESLPSSYYEPTGIIYAVGRGTDTKKVDVSRESGTTEPAPTPTPSPSPSPSPSPAPTVEPSPDVTPPVSEPDDSDIDFTPEQTPDVIPEPDVPSDVSQPDEGLSSVPEDTGWL